MTGAPACLECQGAGWVRAADGGPDACGRCARNAELEWVSRRPERVISKEANMKSMEQTGPAGAGTVTAACVWVAGEPTFELTVYPALLRAMPWFRGGRDVAIILLGGEMRVTYPGPHRLLARITSRLDKLPPVMLRVPRLEYLRPETMAAEPVWHAVQPSGLVITLPKWARPPVTHRAPVADFSSAFAGGRR